MGLKVLIAGDPTVDQFLQYLPAQQGSQSQNWESHERYSLHEIEGGVHQTIANMLGNPQQEICSYIADRPGNRELCSLAEMICIDTDNELASPTRTPLFRGGKQSARVEKFRGYSEREKAGSSGISPNTTATSQFVLSVQNYAPDLIVLNDAGGQLRVDAKFQAFLKNTVKSDDLVIHKCHLPLNVDNPLQNAMNPNKLTKGVLHISANDLRRSDIRLRSHLSWDDVVSDLKSAVVEHNSYLNMVLDKYAVVVIQFDVEGVAFLRKKEEDISCELVFDSSLSEGELSLQTPGYMFGKMNAFLTSLVTTICSSNPASPSLPETKDVFIALAQTRLYAKGYFEISQDESNKEKYSISFPSLVTNKEDLNKEIQLLTSSIHSLNGESRTALNLPDKREQTIRLACEIVQQGFSKVSAIPHLRLGKLLTVDNNEISAFRSIKRLLDVYLGDEARTDPLSIAVFGSPGSGKSFGLKQIAEPLGLKIFEYNLSEIDAEDLPGIFHELRDESLNGRVPLCFFDEFDRNEYELVSRFLAPMQDGVFRDKGRTHPIGRAVLVFAGGLVDTLEGLRKGHALKSSLTATADEEDVESKLRVLKIPDFVSRLNGFIEIQSINPDGCSGSDYILRRAVLFRSMLQRFADKSVIDTSGNALLSEAMIRAFLIHAEYRSDARSMEKIITMSSLSNTAQRFTASDLPSERLLQMHLMDATTFLVEASRTIRN